MHVYTVAFMMTMHMYMYIPGVYVHTCSIDVYIISDLALVYYVGVHV